MQHITEYPIPECERLARVPASDDTWINRKDGQDITTFSKSEETRAQIAHDSAAARTYPILARGIELKSPETNFPNKTDTAKAREAIGDGGVVPASIPVIDGKLMSGHVGYEKFPCGVDYYFITNLQLKRRSNGPKRFEGQLYQSVFTEAGYPFNSLDSIVRTFAQVRKRNLKTDKTDKDCLLVFSRIVLRIYSVLNERFLFQAPVDGKTYDESMPPYLLVFFDQRDLCHSLDFKTAVLEPALNDYKNLDMAKFATQHNFTEFLWLCCGFARRIADELKLVIFEEAAIEKFCENDLNEHWQIYLPQARIRVLRIIDHIKVLNALSISLSCKLKPTHYKVESKSCAGQSSKKGYQVIDTHRLVSKRITTPSLAFTKREIQKVNWPAFLVKHSLLVWTSLDPMRADWDLSMAHHKTRYNLPDEWTADVAMAQFFNNHGSFDFNASDNLKPDPAAFPLTNTLRLAYTFFRDKSNRMCFTPPPSETQPRAVVPAITSPLNLQFPAWRWLLKEALTKPTHPPLVDPNRRRVDLVEAKHASSTVLADPAINGYLATADPAIQELFGAPKLPLLWRVQMVRNTGYFELNPTAKTLVRDPQPNDDLKAIPWNHPAVPSPGTFDVAAYRQTAFMRLSKNLKLSEETKDLLDQPVQSWNMYRAYLQGCVLYKREVDVIRHMLIVVFGSIQSFSDHAQRSKNWNELIQASLISLQWGERLWREMMFITGFDGINNKTAPVARQVRKDFLERYPQSRAIGNVPELIGNLFFNNKHPKYALPALLQRRDFWKEICTLYNGKWVPPKDQADKLMAMALADLEEDVLDGFVTGKFKESDGTFVLHTHILPLHHSVCPVMHYEYKSPMATFDAAEELAVTLRRLALRRFIQPILLMASVMYPAPGVVKYTSPVDGKLYPWSRLPVTKEKDPLVVVLCRSMTTAATRVLNTPDVDWSAELKALREKGGFVPVGCLSAAVELLLEKDDAIQSAAGKKASKEAGESDDKDRQAFLQEAEQIAGVATINQLAAGIIRKSLNQAQAGGEARYVHGDALDCLVRLFMFTIHTSDKAAAETAAFTVLCNELKETDLASTCKRLAKSHPALSGKLQFFLAERSGESKSVAPAQPVQSEPDPTASRPTIPQEEDLNGDEEREEIQLLLEALQNADPKPKSQSNGKEEKQQQQQSKPSEKPSQSEQSLRRRKEPGSEVEMPQPKRVKTLVKPVAMSP